MRQSSLVSLRTGAVLFLGAAALIGCRSPRGDSGCLNCGAVGSAGSITPAVVDSTPMPAPASNERYVAVPSPPQPQPQTQPPRQLQALPEMFSTSQKPVEPIAPPPAVVTDPAVRIPPITGNARPRTESPMRRSFPDITARPEFHHAPDYSTLTGELSFIPQKNQWRLRYASIDQEDRYGGSVTLDSQQLLKGFRSGQLVQVIGEIVDPESRDVAPLYRVRDVKPVAN